MTWHFPENHEENEPVIIDGWKADALVYFIVWLLIAGLWKTVEVLLFIWRLL